MYQIDKYNYTHTEVILGEDHVESLRNLLPHPYDEVWNTE
jgi:hypothetical protein